MANNFTCIIVDDEQHSIDLLSRRINILFDNIEVVGAYTAWEKALTALRTQQCDLLFLDISMPGKNGFDLLKLVPGLESEIIFVTAYDNFALNAFSFAATGYILKPVDDGDLAAAIDKAIKRIEYRRNARQVQASEGFTAKKIGIPDKKGTEYINISDIVYLEAVNGCTRVVTGDGEIISSYALNKFKPVLDKNGFFQINRSFMVNTNRIRRYTVEGCVILTTGLEIPVSKNYRDDFLLIFNKISKADI